MFQTDKLSILLTIIFATLGIGCFNFDLPAIEETTAKTCDEYKSQHDGSLLNPIGASDISYLNAFFGDGYDEWWRFRVSEADFAKIATEVAKTQSGPLEVEFSTNASPPEYWNAYAKIPTWWTPPDHDNLTSINWCFRVGDAQRHHGWFFLFDLRSNDAFVWHWNHQWSSDECR